jgi:hypothetical protein
MGALLSRFLRRQLPLILIAAVIAAAVVWSWVAWPLPVWASVWSLILVAGFVLASKFDLGEKAPTTDDHLGPDCRDGKHRACTGGAWCMTADRPVPCVCPCHGEAVPA